MPTTALPRRKHREQPPSFQERRWLLSGQPGFLWFFRRERITKLWAEYGDIVVERYARSWPFERPPPFWRFHERDFGESPHDYLLRHPELLLPHEKRALRQRQKKAKHVLAPARAEAQGPPRGARIPGAR
jgi:hypothetical protein